MTAAENRAALLAARVLLRWKPAALPVDPLTILRACRDTRVYTLEAAVDALGLQSDDLLRNEDAITLHMPLGEKLHYIVIYRVDGNPARLRFTLAHELGHRLLGHAGSTPAEEHAADVFASHLLCPEPVVRRLSALSADGDDPADRLAVACYVSRACARMALRRPAALPADVATALDALLTPFIPV